MKKKRFLTCIALAIGVHVSLIQAKDWSPPVLEGSEIYEGSTYYLENAGMGTYLAAGGSWGTQAILNLTGLPVTFILDSNTQLYTIQFSPGNTLFRSDDSGSTYTDNTIENQWNIQLKDADNLTYTIQAPSNFKGYNANEYLGSIGTLESTNNGDAYVIKYNRNKDTYANYIEWKFLNVTLYEARTFLYSMLNSSVDIPLDLTSYESIYENSTNPDEVYQAARELRKVIMNYKVSVATPENPIDFTFSIVNPGFDNNTKEGWEGVDAGSVDYHLIEFYENTFNMYQEIQDMPAGKYILRAKGFERPKTNDGGSAYRAGTEEIYASLYIKTNSFPEKSTPFNSLYQHTYSGRDAVRGYVNSMSAAETMFNDTEENYYEIEITDIIVGEGDVLTIGAKSGFQQGSYWVVLDNFRLECEGNDINLILEYVKGQIQEAQEIFEKSMQNAIWQKLNNIIKKAQEAISANPLVPGDLYAVSSELAHAMDTASVFLIAYGHLQTAVDSALEVYDVNAKEAEALWDIISSAQSLAASFDVSSDAIYSFIPEIYRAILAYYIANTTDTAPIVVTNPDFARGATSAFGRMSASGSNIVEQGFCWSTHPNPSVLDNRATKYFNNNGNIYHIENLEPATVYYMRAYALTEGYAVGYGDILKVITIPKGNVTYSFDGSVTGSGEHYPRIVEAITSAVDYFNNLTSIQGHHLSVSYSSGTPTAEASYGGYLRFGPSSSYQRTGTALHEMGHTIGVGQHSYWTNTSSSPLKVNGRWQGERANKVVQFLENDASAALQGDGTHMWPYGINGAHEDTGSEILYIGNSLIHQAIGEDGLPPINGGFTTPAYTFESDDDVKYYIKSEDQSKGRDNTFLIEGEDGAIVYREMSVEDVLTNDNAAWYFKFNPVSGYYRIQNVATGKYFTYRSAGKTEIYMLEVNTFTAAQNFQLMNARISTTIGSGSEEFTTKGYWIIRPQSTANPPCFAASEGGVTSISSFNIEDSSTNQRWLLLSADEVNLFENALNSAGTGIDTNNTETVDLKLYPNPATNWLSISGLKGEAVLHIYDISGVKVKNCVVNPDENVSVDFASGIYFVKVQTSEKEIVRKLIVE